MTVPGARAGGAVEEGTEVEGPAAVEVVRGDSVNGCPTDAGVGSVVVDLRVGHGSGSRSRRYDLRTLDELGLPGLDTSLLETFRLEIPFLYYLIQTDIWLSECNY